MPGEEKPHDLAVLTELLTRAKIYYRLDHVTNPRTIKIGAVHVLTVRFEDSEINLQFGAENKLIAITTSLRLP